MLSRLSIRDIVLIERLDMEFSAGMSVLTGETGAGKSILLDALSLALGARGDGSLVREGCDKGSVTAEFEPGANHPVRALLEANDLEVSADSLILRRIQKGDGKTRAYVNDAAVSAGLLAQIGAMLVEIHGQHESRALLDPASHRSLLDAHGGLERDARAAGVGWAVWQEAESARESLRQEVDEAQREAEYLRASVEELSVLSPEEGEEDSLADKRQRMMKIEQIAADLSEANEVLSGNGSPVSVISNLARRLERKQSQAPGTLDDTLAELDTSLNALYRAQELLEAAFRETQFDPRELEQAEERLFALRAASRKFGVAVENLPELAVKMADSLATLEDGADRLKELDARCEAAKAEYFEVAKALSSKRRKAADALVAAVERELPELKLEQARFHVPVESSDAFAGPNGLDRVEFEVQTNPGTRQGPMRKVASGGELSRLMLALKVALADRGSAPTLVFDEIDTGVGGAVADAIGLRLERLSSQVQVLSVTHAPQVAARAHGHYLISKSGDRKASRTITEVQPISAESRLEEIARMLSGATITNEARAAAETLLNQPAA